MNTMTQLGLVHESEAQRQYARVKIPATLRIKYSDVDSVRYRVIDVSAGGFSFESSGSRLGLKENCPGQLYFTIDGFHFVLDVEFRVVNMDRDNRRVGCEFIQLDSKQVASLRYLITAFLSGELVSTSDMLSTLSRDNYTSPRKHVADNGFGFFARTRAFLFSSIVFLIGLSAAAFVGSQLYQVFFLTRSTSAHLALQSYRVTVPRSAEVSALVEIGDTVARGQPIATFRAPLIEYLADNLPADMDNQQLAEMAENWVPGTLSSPCDCVVANSYVPGKQYLTKGAEAFELVDNTVQPYVSSYFDFQSADNLAVGDKVAVEVLGERRNLQGVVDTVQVMDVAASTILRVRVRLQDQLPASYADRPLRVSKSILPFPLTAEAAAEVASAE